MQRTQVYLTRAQHRGLREEAARLGTSMTEALRRIVDEHLQERKGTARFRKDAVLSFIGLGSSGRRSTSERHDEALAETLRARPVR